MFIREIKGKNKTYLSIVEGYRNGNKVKQRTLLSLGSIDSINEKEIINISSKLLSYCKSNTLVNINDAEEKGRINWGGLAVVAKLWSLFSFDGLFESFLNKRKIKFNLKECIRLMLIDRICHPRSKLQTYLNRAYYSGFESSNITLQNLYRALSFLSIHKDLIEKHIFEQNKKLFGMPVEVVFFDVTTFYFESNLADDLRSFGYSKDAKFNEVQIVLSMLINKDGRPVGFDLFSGNTYEGHTLLEAITKIKDKYNIKKAIIVADRGINTGLNLCAIKNNDFEYIMGCRFKNSSQSLKKEILNLNEYITINTGESDDTLKYKTINYTKIIKKDNRIIDQIEEKIICTWSSKRAKKDKKDRERLVLKAKEMLAANKLEQQRGAKKYIIIKQKEPAQLNEEKIKADEIWDGFYAIETSSKVLNPQEIMSAYHELWRIEESFCLLKSHLETRPIFHWTPTRIRGHFILSYIAFLFERTIEIELKKSGVKIISPRNIRKSISLMEMTEVEINNKLYKIRAPISELGERIINCLEIEMPNRIL